MTKAFPNLRLGLAPADHQLLERFRSAKLSCDMPAAEVGSVFGITEKFLDRTTKEAFIIWFLLDFYKVVFAKQTSHFTLETNFLVDPVGNTDISHKQFT